MKKVTENYPNVTQYAATAKQKFSLSVIIQFV